MLLTKVSGVVTIKTQTASSETTLISNIVNAFNASLFPANFVVLNSNPGDNTDFAQIKLSSTIDPSTKAILNYGETYELSNSVIANATYQLVNFSNTVANNFTKNMLFTIENNNVLATLTLGYDLDTYTELTPTQLSVVSLNANTTITNDTITTTNISATNYDNLPVTDITSTTLTVSDTASVYTIDLPNVGTVGTYAYPTSVTTDSKGRISAITAGNQPVTSLNGTSPIAVNQSTGSVTISLSNTGTAGTYAYPTSVTTDSKGRISAITAGSVGVTSLAATSPLSVTSNTGSITASITPGSADQVLVTNSSATSVLWSSLSESVSYIPNLRMVNASGQILYSMLLSFTRSFNIVCLKMAVSSTLFRYTGATSTNTITTDYFNISSTLMPANQIQQIGNVDLNLTDSLGVLESGGGTSMNAYVQGDVSGFKFILKTIPLGGLESGATYIDQNQYFYLGGAYIGSASLYFPNFISFIYCTN